MRRFISSVASLVFIVSLYAGADAQSGRITNDEIMRVCVGCDMSGVNLQGHDLHGIRLQGTNLRRADLRNANLRGSYLIEADLRNADLRGADLIGADLRGAKLAGADLSTSIFLTQPQLNAATGDAATSIPASLTRPGHWPDK